MARVFRSTFAVLTMLALSASAVWTTQAVAQMKSTQAPAPTMMEQAQPGGAKQVEGKIQKVAGNKVTLTDGTEFTIPASVKVQRNDLKPGASVKASYEEKAGQKIVTSLEVEGVH